MVVGALVGTAEGCFLDAIPGSTTPMLVRALGVIVGRAVLLGKFNLAGFSVVDARLWTVPSFQVLLEECLQLVRV